MTKPKKPIQIPHHTDHQGNPRPIDAIRARANLELTNVVTGIKTLKELDDEITRLCFTRPPEYMVILIEHDPHINKYRSTIYIPKKDSEKLIRRY